MIIIKQCLKCNKDFKCRKEINSSKYCSRICYWNSKKGDSNCAKNFKSANRPPWNKGLKGYNAGAEHWLYGKKRPEMTGEKHFNWKGGSTDADRFERNKFKETIQPNILRRDNYTCQFCEQIGGYLQVDHIKPWAKYPELRFDVNNCRTLCMACHYYVTYKKKMPKGIVWGHKPDRRVA